MKSLKASFIGLGIGQVFYLASLWIFGVASQTKEQLLVTAVCSVIMGLSARIYEGEWSLLAQTSLHFLVILGVVHAMMVANGWLDLANLGADYGWFLMRFTLIYMVFWASIYLYNRGQAKKLNQMIEKKRKTS